MIITFSRLHHTAFLTFLLFYLMSLFVLSIVKMNDTNENNGAHLFNVPSSSICDNPIRFILIKRLRRLCVE